MPSKPRPIKREPAGSIGTESGQALTLDPVLVPGQVLVRFPCAKCNLEHEVDVGPQVRQVIADATRGRLFIPPGTYDAWLNLAGKTGEVLSLQATR